MSAKFDLFKPAADAIVFEAGQAIFKRGQPGDVMYIIQEGEVDIVLYDHLIETVTSGGILGELALIDSRPRSASAVARTESKLVPINTQRFAFLVQETPYFALQVMEVMAERLRMMNTLALQHFDNYDHLDG